MQKVVPSMPRRVLGVGLLFCIAVIFFYFAIYELRMSGIFAYVNLTIGSVQFWAAYKVYVATNESLVFNDGKITSTDGTLVADVENIAKIDRSMFAFKPTNGLLIILRKPMPASWRPGLWWRCGRFVGIGGCTPKHHGKQFAEELERHIVTS